MNFLEQFKSYNLPILDNGVKLPDFQIPIAEVEKRFLDNDISDYQFLLALCLEGMEKKIGKNHPNYKAYQERLNYELKAFKDLGFCGYALITWDIVRFCRENKIATGLCRGSAGGSLVLFLIDVV